MLLKLRHLCAVLVFASLAASLAACSDDPDPSALTYRLTLPARRRPHRTVHVQAPRQDLARLQEDRETRSRLQGGLHASQELSRSEPARRCQRIAFRRMRPGSGTERLRMVSPSHSAER